MPAVLSDENKKLLERYLECILEKNQELNLTHIASKDEAWVLHILDALEAVSEIERAPKGQLVDLGSGGGFPGVPLAVATCRQTLLVDSREKKMKAVQEAVTQADIQNVGVYAGRIEQLAAAQCGKFAVAVARALAKTPVLLELAAPLLKQEGVLVAYKSADCDEELAQAALLEDLLGLSLVKRKAYHLGAEYGRRQLLIYKKVAPAQIRLPRRVGLAQKRPLTQDLSG